MEQIFLQIQTVNDEYHQGEEELNREKQSLVEISNRIEYLRTQRLKLAAESLKAVRYAERHSSGLHGRENAEIEERLSNPQFSWKQNDLQLKREQITKMKHEIDSMEAEQELLRCL